jgi:drug/metabolite transporter (DMT)-like permease
VKGFAWIIWALLAGLSFGLGAFSMGTASMYGMKSRLFMAWGELSFIVLYYLIYFIHKRFTKGYIYNWNESHFKSIDSNSPRVITIFTSLVQGGTHFLGGIAYVISLQYALYAEVNQGVITSIFSLSSFFMTIIGIFVFHERL